jgi:phage baseplate assembly protein W
MAELNSYAADLDLNFSRNAFSGDVNLLSGESAIRRAIKSLLFLKPNEKPFHPEINAGISQLLFENATPVVIMEATNRIKDAITRYEPRIASSNVDIYFDENNTLLVKILYTIRNVKKVYTTTVALERIR